MLVTTGRESAAVPLQLRLDCLIKLALQGRSISPEGGLLLHRELDDALGLTDMAAKILSDPCAGQNDSN